MAAAPAAAPSPNPQRVNNFVIIVSLSRSVLHCLNPPHHRIEPVTLRRSLDRAPPVAVAGLLMAACSARQAAQVFQCA